ncbi:MAG: hypothetical protein FWE82_01105 [Defluviitaleaceae bacterium]|nr:hypothetical protein [Defluviitaleaceae bacterium]
MSVKKHYTAFDGTEVDEKLLALSLKKKSKVESAGDLARVAAPKTTQLVYNVLRIGPRMIMRAAYELLRANAITRLLSAVLLLSIDTVSLVRRRISPKQYIINLTLVLFLLLGGTAGWMLGHHAFETLAPHSAVLPVMGGLAGAALLGLLAGMAGDRLIKIFAKTDAEDMLKIFSNVFAELAREHLLNEQEIIKVKEAVCIDAKAAAQMFRSPDKNEYARRLLEPCVNEALKARQ